MEKQVVRLTVDLVVNDGQLEAFKSIAQSHDLGEQGGARHAGV